MKSIFQFESFVVISLILFACSPAAITQAPDAVAAVTDTQAPTAADETATATVAPTATDTPPANLIHVGELQLVPFAPPWFEGDLATVVFAENGLLRIDAPGSPFEPGDTEGLFKSLVFGAVTLENKADFDISVTFNRQGGVCSGHDKCANFAATACIVFGYFDPDNFQIFCVDESSARFWNIDGYVNAVFSSTSNLQETETIRPLSRLIFQYAEHPEPNEFRLKMQDGVLTGFINGEQIFERSGYQPQACQNLNGILACSPGQVEDPCNYAFMEGRGEQTISGCSALVGKIGIACFYNLPASIAEGQTAQFGFGVGWDVTNCEAEVNLN